MELISREKPVKSGGSETESVNNIVDDFKASVSVVSATVCTDYLA